MLYIFLYLASLTPVGILLLDISDYLEDAIEQCYQGPLANMRSFYFDLLYCSWDTVSMPK